MRPIIFISLIALTTSVSCSFNKRETIPLNKIEISVNLQQNWSYTDVELKKEYRKEMEIYESNAWLIQKILSGLGLKPNPPSMITSDKPLFLCLSQKNLEQKTQIIIGDNLLNFTTHIDQNITLSLEQNGSKQKIGVISNENPNISISLTTENGVLIYSP